MTNLALPTFPGFAAINWQLERNVARAEDPIGGNLQRKVRSGDRWRCTLTAPPMQGNDALVLQAFLDGASRGDNWFYLSPPQNDLSLSAWNPQDAITNGGFSIDTSSWTASGSVLSTNARRIKVLNSGAASGYASQALTVSTGVPYAAMTDRRQGKVANWRLQLLNSTPTAEVNQAYTTEDRSVELWTPTTASSSIRLLTDTAVANDYVYWGNVSVCRCAQINGGSQTGNRLNIDGLPASTNSALKAGNFVAVKLSTNWQLLRLVDDLDSDSGGAGQLVFEATLRESPADNSVVLVRNPFAKFTLSQAASISDLRAPNFYGFTFDAVEDITA